MEEAKFYSVSFEISGDNYTHVSRFLNRVLNPDPLGPNDSHFKATFVYILLSGDLILGDEMIIKIEQRR
jgi:hypothetical protein